MDPIDHWVDIDLDPELAKLQLIVGLIGAAYFAWAYWRMKRRKSARANAPTSNSELPADSN
jgi:threonine/homoserine/homoserine lactone efflux protein